MSRASLIIRIAVAAGATCVAATRPASAQTVHLDCIADTYVFQSSPASFLGSDVSALTAGQDSSGQSVAVLKFSLNDLPIFGTATLNTAHLYVYCSNVNYGTLGQLQVGRFTYGTGWDDVPPNGLINWDTYWNNGAPRVDMLGAVTTPLAGQWAAFDVLPIIQGPWQQGSDECALVVQSGPSNTNPGWGIFYSREYPSGQYRPYLRVSYTITQADCNNNGIPDACDLNCGAVGGPCSVPGCGQSSDCNTDGVPDECQLLGSNDSDGNGSLDVCQPYVTEPAPLQPSETTGDSNTMPVNLERLLHFDGLHFVGGSFSLDLNRPTYILAHGWDSNPGNMETIAFNIAQSRACNLLAWDWEDSANPDAIPGSPIVFGASAAVSATIPWVGWSIASALGLAGWLDGFRSGLHAGDEGNELGAKLAELGALGANVHLIGTSHGGGLLGRAASAMKKRGSPATSLTTLDTPRALFVDSLQYVDPSAVNFTAVFYYPSLIEGGFGAPVAGNATNVALNPQWASWPAHLYIGDSWFPAHSLLAVTFDGDPFVGTALDVIRFPTGCWDEQSTGSFFETPCPRSSDESVHPTNELQVVANDAFDSAAGWTGRGAVLATRVDPLHDVNPVIFLRENGETWVGKEIALPREALLLAFDYSFRQTQSAASLTAYVNGQEVFFDSAANLFTESRMTQSDYLYVGHVAGTNVSLKFVARGGPSSNGGVAVDNLRVWGAMVFNEAISRSYTVINRAGSVPEFDDSVSRSQTVINRDGSEPVLDESISRSHTVINRSGGEPLFTESISRAATACNFAGVGDDDGDGVNDCEDLCDAFPDSIDMDMDGVPDGCDACPLMPGDLNADYLVDAGDIPVFIDILLGNPNPNACSSDLNSDGLTDGQDIQPFVFKIMSP